MQAEYLNRLSGPVKQFVFEIEGGAGLDIWVVPDFKLNFGGTSGEGQLEVQIDSNRIMLFVPTNGYFPDGAVRHELLHIQRFHVQGIPKIALADSEPWQQHFADGIAALDNAVEHLIIVPQELLLHPERQAHWKKNLELVCSGLDSVPESEKFLSAYLHWAFLKNALPSSPQIEVVKEFLIRHGVFDEGTRFSDEFLSLAHSKEDMVRLLFRTFPQLPRSRMALEYVGRITGRRQAPIP